MRKEFEKNVKPLIDWAEADKRRNVIIVAFEEYERPDEDNKEETVKDVKSCQAFSGNMPSLISYIAHDIFTGKKGSLGEIIRDANNVLGITLLKEKLKDILNDTADETD